MKWFFAFNQLSEKGYGDFVRVAVISARRHTSLEAICLYDGAPSELTVWLKRQGVRVLPCRSRFTPWWEQNNPSAAPIAAGAFLRMEIPDVMAREGMDDEFALYTDCDVIFRRDVAAQLEPLRPRFFCVAPETFVHSNLHMNSGVMWMNIARLRECGDELMRFAEHRMQQASASSFDQGIYRAFFDPLHRLSWRAHLADCWFYAVLSRVPLRTWQWDDLPLELNWKPYWGPNDHASVIHFHGLKPTQRAELAAGTLPPFIAVMHTPFWDECAARWDELLKEAMKTS